MSISKIFNTKLCVCSHKCKIQNISDGIFILSPGSWSIGSDLGGLGVPRGSMPTHISVWGYMYPLVFPFGGTCTFLRVHIF